MTASPRLGRAAKRCLPPLAALIALGPASIIFEAGAAAQQRRAVSVYLRAADRADTKRCTYRDVQAGADGPGHCEHRCKGPIDGVGTRLLSCADYERLDFIIDGRAVSTWKAMTKVGGFAGLGHRKRLIEWIFARKRRTRSTLLGAIVRFSGTPHDRPNRRRSRLAVFSLRAGALCWKGNVARNTQARELLLKGPCKGPLE
jgi:hypothetical protein